MSSIVVSPHHLSSKAGKNILQIGGNAVDAAIAVNIVQGVVAPETCGVGGDLFALIWRDGSVEPDCLDASGYAGSKVDGETIPGDTIPLNHPMSVTVPGAVDGWFKCRSQCQVQWMDGLNFMKNMVHWKCQKYLQLESKFATKALK